VTYGGDSGNRIFVLYWRCPLITVSVIRGSTVIVILESQSLDSRPVSSIVLTIYTNNSHRYIERNYGL
jgi:hypothetical protein